MLSAGRAHLRCHHQLLSTYVECINWSKMGTNQLCTIQIFVLFSTWRQQLVPTAHESQARGDRGGRFYYFLFKPRSQRCLESGICNVFFESDGIAQYDSNRICRVLKYRIIVTGPSLSDFNISTCLKGTLSISILGLRCG